MNVKNLGTKHFYFIILLCCTAFGAYRVYHYIDVQLADDTHYLRLGLQLPKIFLSGYGPLYSLFFRCIFWLTNSKWDTYFLAYSILIAMPTIAMYFFLQSKKIETWLCFLVAILFFISPYNLFFDNWSKIGHFAVTIILLGLMIYEKFEGNVEKQLLILSMISFVLGYVRPEFHLSWLVYVCLYFIILFLQKKYRDFIIRGAMLIPFFVVYYLFFSPLRGGRSIIAFAQQFVANKCISEDTPITDSVDYMRVFYSYFGEVKKISQALIANPHEFFHHIALNVTEFITKCFTLFSGWLLVEKLWMPSYAFLLFSGIILFLICIYFFIKSFMPVKHYIYVLSGILPVILFIPTFIACIVMRPNAHYLIVFTPLFIYLLLPLLCKLAVPRLLGFGIVCLATIGFLFFWNIHKYTLGNPWHIETSQCISTPNKATYNKLLPYKERENLCLLDVEGGINFYLNKTWKWSNPFAKNFSPVFTRYIKEEKVDIIYCSEAMCRIRQYRMDSTFQNFRKNPEQYGYRFLPLADKECVDSDYFGIYIK
jgi:hypothetical protein